ncbi:hypothetical protein BH23GEM6_BH23GEM6_16080 [soil metagenome]
MSAWIRLSRCTLVVGVLALASCVGTGAMADVLMGGAGSRDVSGEVRNLDERNRTIQVSNWYGGSSVRYDNRTQVVYEGRSFPIRSLNRGDRVSIRVERDNRGDLYARRIVLERTSRTARRQEDRRNIRTSFVEGRVHRIDQRQGWMEVRPGRGPTVQVTLPQRPSRQQVSSFNRLRRGDHVRIEAVERGRNQLELIRIIRS